MINFYIVDNERFAEYLRKEKIFKKQFNLVSKKIRKEFRLDKRTAIGNSVSRLYLIMTPKDLERFSVCLNRFGMVKRDSRLNLRYMELVEKHVDPFKPRKYWEWHNWEGGYDDMVVKCFYTSGKVFMSIESIYETEVTRKFKEISKLRFLMARLKFKMEMISHE